MKKVKKTRYELARDYRNAKWAYERLQDISRDLNTVKEHSPKFTFKNTRIELNSPQYGMIQLYNNGVIASGFHSGNINTDEEEFFSNDYLRGVLSEVAKLLIKEK